MNLESLLPDGVAPTDAISTLAGVVIFITLITIWQTMLTRDPAAARARSIGQRANQLKAQALANDDRQRRERQAVNVMRRLVTALKLVGGKGSRRVILGLARAGFRGRDAIVVFMFFKLVMPVAFAAATVFVFHGMHFLELTSQSNSLAVVAGGILGFFSPNIYIKNRGDKRRVALRKGLPDAIDLLVICTEAGLALDATLDRVSREIIAAYPEMGDELALTGIELRFLPERRKALENLGERTDLPGIQGLINTLIQTEKYGTPLAQSLRVLANEMRNDRMMRAEEKAARLPAIMTIPMVLFIMPALFMVLMGPGIIKLMDGLKGIG